MFRRTCTLILAFLAAGPLLSAQQTPALQRAPAPQPPPSRTIALDVVVTTPSGQPVAGLAKSDLTLLDNTTSRDIVTFRQIGEGQTGPRYIVLVDAVNIPFSTVAYIESQVEKFLHNSGPQLKNPATIAVLTDKGLQTSGQFSTDPAVLIAALDKLQPGLRQIGRAEGFWGADERFQISENALLGLTNALHGNPSQTVLLWISPGWPLLSGPGIRLDSKQQQNIFRNIVDLSTAMRQSNLSIYNINPLGAVENLLRTNYYKEFLKGIREPRQTDLGDLSLQVLAVQSGGLVFDGSTDVAALLAKCMTETETTYEITFPAAPAERPDEYHHLEIKLDKPGMTARTRDGYYAQP